MEKHRRCLAALVLGIALALFTGCGSVPSAPPPPPWDGSPVVPLLEPGKGYLSVDEVDLSVFTGRGPQLKLAPFVLLDGKGKFLAQRADKYPYLPPLTLWAGKYTVLARIQEEERRIPVVIEEGKLTRVHLHALNQGRAVKEGPVEAPPEPRP